MVSASNSYPNLLQTPTADYSYSHLIQASEQDPLLHDGDAHNDTPKPSRSSRVREIALFTWALVATAAVIIVAVWAQHTQQTAKPKPPPDAGHHGKRNLIFMVSDGMGPASLSLTRTYRQHVENLPIDDVLTLDKHFWGTSRTRSSSSLVTDSAAGATAFSCGKKSYNGAIAVTPDHEPCGSVMEAAKRVGYTTGLVVTTSIADATPACFVSHVLQREQQDDIALQEVGEGVLGRTVDLILGGGRCYFVPNTTEGSCRVDEIDVTKIAQEKHGWSYSDNRAGFDALKGGEDVALPHLGLYADYEFPFEIDRRRMNDVYPSLSEMTVTALRALDLATADSDQGFFLMIEGSRIDNAGHNNDPAAQVREVLEYDKAFQAVIEFLEQSETDGVLVATSDHETGGLATAIQKPGHLPTYNWYPQALAQANYSVEYLGRELINHVLDAVNKGETIEELKAWINTELIIAGLGINDITEDELTLLASSPLTAQPVLAAIISLRAYVGWSTHGHTAIDVNIYSSGGVAAADALRGNVENTDVGKFLRNYLSVASEVEDITKELKEKMVMGAKDTSITPSDSLFHDDEVA